MIQNPRVMWMDSLSQECFYTTHGFPDPPETEAPPVPSYDRDERKAHAKQRADRWTGWFQKNEGRIRAMHGVASEPETEEESAQRSADDASAVGSGEPDPGASRHSEAESEGKPETGTGPVGEAPKDPPPKRGKRKGNDGQRTMFG